MASLNISKWSRSAVHTSSPAILREVVK